MILSQPPALYSKELETTRNREIERADMENHKRGRDIEVGPAAFILTSDDGTRYEIYVTDGGDVGVREVGGDEIYMDKNPFVQQAVREVEAKYGEVVSVIPLPNSVDKFGRNDDLGTTEETIWQVGGDEVYRTTNSIDTVSSSSAADTSVSVRLDGHTISGGELTFVSQTVSLNGQTKVVLATPLARCDRMAIEGAVVAAGDVYVYQDGTISGGVPSTASDIHNVIRGTESQTQTFKTAVSVGNNKYAFVTAVLVSVNKKQAASVDIILESRQGTDVFRPMMGRFAISTAAQPSLYIPFNPYLIVPENSDIRMRAIASDSGTSVDATFQAYVASVV